MKILLVGDYSSDPRLGSTKVYYKLREEFASLGHHCAILFAEDLGTTRLPTYLRQVLAPVLTARSVIRWIREHGHYDIIDVAGGEGIHLSWLKQLGWFPKTAIISRSHGLEHLNYQRMLADHKAGLLYKPWTRRLWFPAVRLSQVAAAARWSDRLIVLNPEDEMFVINKGWKKPARIDLIPHGVSEHFLGSATQPAEARAQGILYCGTWTGSKGVDYLARAYSALVAEGMRTPLTLLGGHVPEAKIREAFSEQARPLINVLERASEEEVIRHFRTHDILIFPSTYEGFGMVLLEAMSQGLPPVSTTVGCGPMLIQSGKNGILVPPRDSCAIQNAVRTLMDDPVRRRRLGDAARETAAKYTWKLSARRTLDAYHKAWSTLGCGRTQTK